MPQGKKNKRGGRSAKKLNKGKNKEKENKAPLRQPRATDDTNNGLKNRRVDGDDTFDLSDAGLDDLNSTEAPTYNTVYAKYKGATERFKKALLGKLPKSKYVSPDECNVNDLMDAAEFVAESDIVVEKDMMDDLRIALMARKRASTYFGTIDQGHSHFLIALEYCRGKLQAKYNSAASKAREASKKQENEPDGSEEEEKVANRFAALSLHSNEAEEEEEEEGKGEAPPLPFPSTRPKVPDEFGEALANGEDRLDAILFIITLEELMEDCAYRYSCVKETYQECKTANVKGAIPALLMKAAVFSNYAIQLVTTLETELAAAHPHLDSIYNVLVLVALPHTIKMCQVVVRQGSQCPTDFTRAHAVEFLGECPTDFTRAHAVEFLGELLAASFRGLSYGDEEVKRPIRNFANRWKVAYNIVQALFTHIDRLRIVETRNKVEDEIWEKDIAFTKESARQLFGECPEEYSWLHGKFIGGNRAMTATIKHLQFIGHCLHIYQDDFHADERSMFKLPGSESYIGGEWKEDARKIQGDMDCFLFGDVLPTLINVTKSFSCSEQLPFQRELKTIFTEIKSFVKNPTKPIRWSLAFSIHLLLTSVIEVQGDGDVESIGMEANQACEKFARQINWMKDKRRENSRPHAWEKKLVQWSNSFDALTTPFDRKGEPMSAQERRALWNPVCAGNTLLFLAYVGNLWFGTCTINKFNQLKGVLHLYNGFKVRGILQEGKLEVLDFLHETLKHSRGVWKGSIPQRGNMMRQWCLCLGLPPAAANYFHSTDSDLFDASELDIRLGSRIANILPNHFAHSFGRLCRHELPDCFVSHHSLFEGEVDRHKILSEDTATALSSDMQVLSTNIGLIGQQLFEFYLKLSEEMGFERTMGMDAGNCGMEKWECRVMIAGNILKYLDKCDEPIREPAVLKAADCMKDFFSRLTLDEFSYFSHQCPSATNVLSV